MVHKELHIVLMDKLEDLLPGIEEFLCNVLANESLSTYAEEQRQYYLERLDIIKLPPSIPPRPQSLGVHVPLYPVISSTPPSNRDSFPGNEQDDFAAYQRELSRALVDSETSPDITEVKVYDDIDTTHTSCIEIAASTSSLPNEEEGVYEIPQLSRAISHTLHDPGYEKAVELSPLSKSSSSEEQFVNVTTVAAGPPIPPPLPPRRDRTHSDAASRSSIGSILEDRVPQVTTPQSAPALLKTRLDRKHSMPINTDISFDTRSERSADDLIIDEYYDGVSCDSLDDLSGSFKQPNELSLSIRLPKPTRRKARAQRKLGKSLSSLWEISQPFRALEDIVISGELYYKSKLSWTKKLVALTNGRLVCYKMDKPDARPSFVIMLTGYLATFHKRDGRRSHEIHLDHDNFEAHVFLVDFKEWAETWCEHLNYAAEGKRLPGPVLHLARDSLTDKHDPNTYHIAKSNAAQSNSNMSLASTDAYDIDGGKSKKTDSGSQKSKTMGSIAQKASQFFLGRRSSTKKLSRSASSDRNRSSSNSGIPEDVDSTGSIEAYRCLVGSESSLADSLASPVTPDTVAIQVIQPATEVQKHVKHQGFLDIYSNFNKRKWGKRWCLIHENNFECYRSPTSDVCELEFLLRDCVLRRAIEETKSELGLMLLENDREKLTIEPLSWSELGSWLRVLMQETSTGETPEGLQGYMDDSHPYHEAVEITRTMSRGGDAMGRDSGSHKHENRDSGIGSSESNEGKFGSMERAIRLGGTPVMVHRSFTDTNLPSVNDVPEGGAIYAQVRKNSRSGTPSRGTPKQTRAHANKGGVDAGVANKLDTGYNENITEDNMVKSESSGTFELDEETLFSDFEKRISIPDVERGESLVDEIMSQLNSQLQNGGSESNTDLPSDADEQQASKMDPSWSIDSNESKTDTMEPSLSKEPNEAKSNKVILSSKGQARKPAFSHSEAGISEKLYQLRTILVQLKQDRITIRDRRQQVNSDIDREFLTEEFERLNRECNKVSEEIKCLEEEQASIGTADPTKLATVIDENENIEEHVQEIDQDSLDFVKSETIESESDILESGKKNAIREGVSKVIGNNCVHRVEKGPGPEDNAMGEAGDSNSSIDEVTDKLLSGISFTNMKGGSSHGGVSKNQSNNGVLKNQSDSAKIHCENAKTDASTSSCFVDRTAGNVPESDSAQEKQIHSAIIKSDKRLNANSQSNASENSPRGKRKESAKKDAKSKSKSKQKSKSPEKNIGSGNKSKNSTSKSESGETNKSSASKNSKSIDNIKSSASKSVDPDSTKSKLDNVSDSCDTDCEIVELVPLKGRGNLGDSKFPFNAKAAKSSANTSVTKQDVGDDIEFEKSVDVLHRAKMDDNASGKVIDNNTQDMTKDMKNDSPGIPETGNSGKLNVPGVEETFEKPKSRVSAEMDSLLADFENKLVLDS